MALFMLYCVALIDVLIETRNNEKSRIIATAQIVLNNDSESRSGNAKC